MTFDSGGNGINVSQFVRALGGETVATGIIGGFTGYFIEEDLAEFDIQTDFCRINSAPTRINTTILVPETAGNDSGETDNRTSEGRPQYQLKHPGPHVTDHVVDLLVETVRKHDPEILNIGGSFPPGLEVGAIDRIASAGDWDTAIDIHGDAVGNLENTYEFCRLNRTELETATGMTVESISECREAALELQNLGFDRVIASMGSEGAIYATPETVLYAPAKEADVVDTVAAGDALFGAILWAAEQGWSDERALRAGVATAWKVVTVTGSSVRDLHPQALMEDVQVWEFQR